MVPGTVHRSPGTYITAQGNLGKAQIGDRRCKLCDQSSLKWGPLPLNTALQEMRRKERRKEVALSSFGTFVKTIFLHRSS
jgi:hypothetical protein